MKKFLLTLLTVVMSVSSSWAEELTETLSFSTQSNGITITKAGAGEPGGDVELSKGDVTVTSAGGQAPANSALQIYKTKSMTVSVPGNYVIKSIDFTYPTKCYPFAEAIPSGLANATTKTSSGNTTATFTAGTPASEFTFTNVADGQTKVNKIVVHYEKTGDAVAVTGISLDKTSITLMENETETLVATVAPVNASNKRVTWETSNMAVARVNDGVVKAIGVGTATITVKTTDGNYTATCSVTVNAFVQPDFATITFAPNVDNSDGANWSTSSAISSVFSEGAEYVSAISATTNVSPARNSLGAGAKFGSSSNVGEITFSLAHPLNVSKVIVTAAPYGDSEGQDGFTLNTVNVPMTNGKNKLYADYEVNISGEVSEINLKSKKASKGRIYVRSISFVKTGAPATVTVDVNDCGNASFSCDKALDFTNVSGVKAYMVTAETAENVTLTEVKKVPANTGIFVVGDGGSYLVDVLYGTCTDNTSDNLLHATTTPYAVTGSDNVWALSKTDGLLHPVTSGTIAAGKAYLVSAVGGSARALVLDNESTGIQSVQQNAQNGVAYNLAGQRVAANAKGIVIMNGKKYLNK